MAYISQKEKKELAPNIKKVLKKYGMKGTIAIDHYSSLVVNLKEGPIDFKMPNGHTSVNVYWIDDHYEGVAKEFLNELLTAMKGTKWYCNDNAMIDYFDRAYFTDINVGKWNKEYVLKEAA